jgi:hypothetical protein
MDRLNVRNILRRKKHNLEEVTTTMFYMTVTRKKPPFTFSSPALSVKHAGAHSTFIGTSQPISTL